MYISILTISSTSSSSTLHHAVSSGSAGSHHKTADRVLAHTLPIAQLLHTTTSAVATGGAGSRGIPTAERIAMQSGIW